jgi:predicted transporter
LSVVGLDVGDSVGLDVVGVAVGLLVGLFVVGLDVGVSVGFDVVRKAVGLLVGLSDVGLDVVGVDVGLLVGLSVVDFTIHHIIFTIKYALFRTKIASPSTH